MTNPSPCLRIRTSFTSVGKRISCGSRTAWLAPFRNIDARRATPLDMDLAADLDAADLTFPVRTRFIDCPLIRSDAQLAYALHMATSRTSICPDAAGFRCIATNPHSNWRLIFQQIGQFLSDTPKNAPNPGGWPRSALYVIGRENRVLQSISARFFGIFGRQWT